MDRAVSTFRTRAKTRNPKGFTLLETLLAVALLALGLAFLLQALGMGVVASGENENDATAAVLAQEKMEELESLPYASVASEPRAAVSGFPVYEREVTVSTPLTGLKEISVSVYWLFKSQERTLSLVTYVSDV